MRFGYREIKFGLEGEDKIKYVQRIQAKLEKVIVRSDRYGNRTFGKNSLNYGEDSVYRRTIIDVRPHDGSPANHGGMS